MTSATSAIRTTNIPIFYFEETTSLEQSKVWFRQRLIFVPCIAGLYILLIFGGRRFMKNRARFNLRTPLAIWNLGLAMFSILGSFRICPELFEVLSQKDGFFHSVCTNGYTNNKVAVCWTGIMTMSKIIELGDTLFIVARKQPLIFLHWYHHATVMMFGFYAAAEYDALCRYFVSLNFAAHSFMYTYYGLRALGVKIPKPIAVAITSFQIFQMVMGMIVNLYALRIKANGIPCDARNGILYLGLAMYISYFILFAHFFYKTYLCQTKSKEEGKQA